MEFWGVEVKPGQSLKVKPEGDKILHLSQVVLGEGKKDKGNDSVTIFLKIGDQKLVLGVLSPEKFPQLAYDLIFEKEFELSHNWKSGSLHFCGYQTFGPEEGDDFGDSSSEEEEEALPIIAKENGKPAPKVEETKNATAKANALKPATSDKPKVKLVEPSKNDDEDDESDDDDESAEGDSDDESDEEMDDAESDDDDESDEEDEETPKKVVQGKKRQNESATKTPIAAAKKAKAEITPQKTDGKKGGHTATPHPAKKAGKSPNSGAKTPKSSGHSCGSCSKTFNSDAALKSHNKAKHGGN